MTRARTASYGVVTPPPLQLLLQAVLMLCVSLVQGVRTTHQMWRRRGSRDWHTHADISALPEATSGIPFQGTNTTYGVILGLVPRISVGTLKGFAVDPLEANNQDFRLKAENDSVALGTPGMEADKVRVPGEGRGPVLRAAQTHIHGSALTHADQTPALILSLSKDAGDAAERFMLKSA